jgi:hypothetical protein
MQYIIDVNPNYLQRTFQLLNTVDAKFLDTHTGTSIGIYGLSDIGSTSEEDLIISTKKQKNYAFSNIFPLVRTELSGIPTWRPNQVDDYLSNLYSYHTFRPGIINVN